MSGLSPEEVDSLIVDTMEQLNKVIGKAQRQMESTISGFEKKQTETIRTLTDLVHTLQTTQAPQANVDPKIIQENVMACVRGECRRIQMNIDQMKQEQARLSQFINSFPQQLQNQISQALPQAPPEPKMFTCEICGSQFYDKVERCPYCGVYLDWTGLS